MTIKTNLSRRKNNKLVGQLSISDELEADKYGLYWINKSHYEDLGLMTTIKKQNFVTNFDIGVCQIPKDPEANSILVIPMDELNNPLGEATYISLPS